MATAKRRAHRSTTAAKPRRAKAAAPAKRRNTARNMARKAPSLAQAEEQARAAVNKWMAGAAAVSWVPGSMLVLGAADYAMIRAVARSFHVDEFDMEAVVGVVGASLTGKLLAEGLSFIPIAGWIAKAAIAGGITKAMGEAVIVYMRDRSPLEK